MGVRLTFKTYFYTATVGLILLLGIVLGRAEFFLFGLPLVMGLLAPLFFPLPPIPQVRRGETRRQCFEGQPLTVPVQIQTRREIPLLEVRLERGSTLRTRLAGGQAMHLDWEIPPQPRGVHSIGRLDYRVLDLTGSFWVETVGQPGDTTLVYPEMSLLRIGGHLARKSGLSHGDHLSRIRGEGIEFAGIRTFQQGDSAHRINWRTSLKWGRLHVNERVQERNTDVILVIETLREIGQSPNTSLNLSARAAASISQVFLRQKDRVGLIEFGGAINWVKPQTGKRQQLLILERLARMRRSESLANRQISTIPKMLLPPGSLVIVFSTLLDQRAYAMVNGLAARGFDPLVIHISPVALVSELIDQNSTLDRLALRWWAVEQRRQLGELEEAGLRVFSWDGKVGLELLNRIVLQQRK